MKSGVYKITNLNNNKFYIGSSQNIKRRTQGHLNDLRANRHPNSHLQRSFNKHGEDRFIFETIINCPLDGLLVIEQYYIDFLQPHYNMSPTAGTTRGYKHREESKRKMTESRLVFYQNNKVSEETKQKQRLAGLGRKMSEEAIKKGKITKLNKSQEERDKDHQSKFKPVYQIDPVSLEIINEFKSIKDGAKSINIDQTYISGVLLGYQYTAGGYIWCLVKNYSKEKILAIKELINKPHYKCRNIAQYDVNMAFIQNFNSIKSAADQLGIKQSRIGDALRRSQKTAGFYWKYIQPEGQIF